MNLVPRPRGARCWPSHARALSSPASSRRALPPSSSPAPCCRARWAASSPPPACSRATTSAHRRARRRRRAGAARHRARRAARRPRHGRLRPAARRRHARHPGARRRRAAQRRDARPGHPVAAAGGARSSASRSRAATSSALYGANATGGVIQIFTRRGSSGLRGEASATVGSRATRARRGQRVRRQRHLARRASPRVGSAPTATAPSIPAVLPNANPDDDGNQRRHAALALDADVAPGHALGAGPARRARHRRVRRRLVVQRAHRHAPAIPAAAQRHAARAPRHRRRTGRSSGAPPKAARPVARNP